MEMTPWSRSVCVVGASLGGEGRVAEGRGGTVERNVSARCIGNCLSKRRGWL